MPTHCRVMPGPVSESRTQAASESVSGPPAGRCQCRGLRRRRRAAGPPGRESCLSQAQVGKGFRVTINLQFKLGSLSRRTGPRRPGSATASGNSALGQKKECTSRLTLFLNNTSLVWNAVFHLEPWYPRIMTEFINLINSYMKLRTNLKLCTHIYEFMCIYEHENINSWSQFTYIYM